MEDISTVCLINFKVIFVGWVNEECPIGVACDQFLVAYTTVHASCTICKVAKSDSV
jgi:hypothetical protein